MFSLCVKGIWSFKMRRALLVFVFFFLSVSLSTFNSWILRSTAFHFPIFLTWFQAMVLSVFYGASHLFCPRESSRLPGKSWMLIIGVLSSINVVYNNSSLSYISLGLNQIIRSSITLITFILKAVGDRKWPRPAESFGLLLLSIGVVWTIRQPEQTDEVHVMGVTFCLLSVVSGSLMLILISHCLEGDVSTTQITCAIAPFNFLLLSIPLYYYELSDSWTQIVQQKSQLVPLLLINSILAACLLISQNILLQSMGPVLLTILGQIKLVSLLLISSTILRTHDDANFDSATIGWLATVTGSWIYVFCRNDGIVFQNLKSKYLCIVGRETVPQNSK